MTEELGGGEDAQLRIAVGALRRTWSAGWAGGGGGDHRRIKRSEALLQLAVARNPRGIGLDDLVHAHRRRHRFVDIAPDAGGDAAQQRGAEGGALLDGGAPD